MTRRSISWYIIRNFILGNMLTLKGAIRAVNEVVRAGTRYNAMDHMDKMF